ncbi:hypothetical protein BB559_003069 [Furculomyces boomerangus]|uniref:Uncharacterized protein n=2 Tax=Harpellales TaxID=61421 RepID=A0A2T9YPC3_9FUNG|nr:hypothetical protein BB559_003069 [Furculomyces boomerangus]PVZ96839.1 hypothetical protein BB558_007236 [Smittium angustum]
MVTNRRSTRLANAARQTRFRSRMSIITRNVARNANRERRSRRRAELTPEERLSLSGNFVLPVFNMPQENTQQYRIHKLWESTKVNGILLKRFSWQLNNALALALQVVSEIHQQNGYSPRVIIQGKLYHILSNIYANSNETPRFAQIYIHDPDHNNNLRECNNYIQDFISVIEQNPREIVGRELVIYADAVPHGQHPCRYNG